MVLRVSGKNLDIGEALRGQIETRVDAVLARYSTENIPGM